MKKTRSIFLIAAAALVFVPLAEAKTTASAANAGASQQWEQDQRRGRYDRRDRRSDRRWNDRRNDRRWNDRRWNRGRTRSYITTRIVRRWFRTYRETIRVTYLPNGRVRTQVIRRVRIR